VREVIRGVAGDKAQALGIILRVVFTEPIKSIADLGDAAAMRLDVPAAIIGPDGARVDFLRTCVGCEQFAGERQKEDGAERQKQSTLGKSHHF
jgi:hypothetical protein